MAEGDVVFRTPDGPIVVCRHGERKIHCPVCGPPLPPPRLPMQILPFKHTPPRSFSPTANARAALALFRGDPWRPFRDARTAVKREGRGTSVS